MKTTFNKYIIMAFAALLSLTANAAEPDWSCDANDYEYDMTVFAALSINGQTVAPSEYTLAAFCGEECRGVATVVSSNGNDYYYLRVRSNVKSGETITFRAYNKTADEEVKQHWLLTSLPFTANERTGFPSTPFVVTFQVPTYTVSVATSPYGTIEGAGEYEEGAEATFTAVPNNGYKFVSWYNGSTENPLIIQVLDNMEVSATFAPKTYTVTYMIDQEVIRIDEVEYASALPTEPTAPEKEGHTFAGWEEHPAIMPANNLTINGSYTVNSYKLTYMIGETVISEIDVEYGAPLTAIEAPTKEGHTFDGWSGLPETMPAHDVTVTGSYTVNTYTLTFKIGDDVISETMVAYGSEIVEPTAPEKEGHTFAGWDEHPATMPASDLTISGSYTVNSYKLTYMIGETVISEIDVEYGAPLTAIEAPTKEGHTFDGWSGLPETMPAHDVTVTGSYTVNSYTLTFKIGEDVISETYVAYGSEIVEPTAPEKDGHTFAGWDEHPATMPASDLTINGNYSVNIYTVTYKIDEDTIRVDYVEYGTVLPEAPNASEKPGYDFEGWFDIPETMPAKDIVIVGKYATSTGIFSISSDSVVDVFDIQGHLVKKDVVFNRITEYLPKGIYIINKRKVLIK